MCTVGGLLLAAAGAVGLSMMPLVAAPSNNVPELQLLASVTASAQPSARLPARDARDLGTPKFITADQLQLSDLTPLPRGTPIRHVTISLGDDQGGVAGPPPVKIIQYSNISDFSGFFFPATASTVVDARLIADDIHDDPTVPLSTLITDFTIAYVTDFTNPDGSGTFPPTISVYDNNADDTIFGPLVCSFDVLLPDSVAGGLDLVVFTLDLQGLPPEQQCKKPGPDYWLSVDYNAAKPILPGLFGTGPLLSNVPHVGTSDNFFAANRSCTRDAGCPGSETCDLTDPAKGICTGGPYMFFFGACPPDGPDPCANFFIEILGVETQPQLNNNLCIERRQIYDGKTPFTNVGATFDGPLDPVSGLPCLSTMTGDVWWNYIATEDGTVDIDTCQSTGISDTTLVVYDGCDCTTLHCEADGLPGGLLAANDDLCGSPRVVIRGEDPRRRGQLLQDPGRRLQRLRGPRRRHHQQSAAAAAEPAGVRRSEFA